MPDIYVIVADSAQARILHSTGKEDPLLEHEILAHPEGRMHARELTSDLSGHGSNHVGSGKHIMDPSSDPKKHENENFAREISDMLNKLVEHNPVDQIMLVAPPALLGLLRNNLAQKVKELVSLELDKNLAQLKVEELRSYLPYFKPTERLMT